MTAKLKGKDPEKIEEEKMEATEYEVREPINYSGLSYVKGVWGGFNSITNLCC